MNRNEGLEAEDKDAFAEENEEEEELLTQLGNSIGQLIKLHSDTGALMPWFDSHVAPTFGPYLQPTVNEHFQIVACCLIDDTRVWWRCGGEICRRPWLLLQIT